MPLISMKPVLRAARDAGYAVGAFNPVDYASMRAIVAAAEAADAPVIVQTSIKTVKYWGADVLSMWAHDLAGKSPVPVALHLDHGNDLDIVRTCVESGWTDVMVDASHEPYEDNLRITKEVDAVAAPKGIGIEAELGKISGVEEQIVVAEADAVLADPDEAVAFCEAVDLAVFAPAIGTAHGVYKGEPNVALDRLEEIGKRTATPLALHGGTGLEDDLIQTCIRLGCAKVNISTNLKHAFIDGFAGYTRENPDDYEPLRVLGAQDRAMRELLEGKIRQFGGAGRGRALASSILN